MPGLNGMGPQANGPMSGRGFGRCRMITIPAKMPAIGVQQTNEGNESAMLQDPSQNNPAFGRGLGGISCGCGRGFGFGGGRRIRR